jgi:hypothetical protein
MRQVSKVLSEQELLRLKEKLCHITEGYINELCVALAEEFLNVLEDASIAVIDGCYHKLSGHSQNLISLEKKQESIVCTLVQEARGVFVSKSNTKNVFFVLNSLSSIIKDSSSPIDQLTSKIGVCRDLLASLYKNNLPAFQEMIARQDELKTHRNIEWGNFLTTASFELLPIVNGRMGARKRLNHTMHVIREEGGDGFNNILQREGRQVSPPDRLITHRLA